MSSIWVTMQITRVLQDAGNAVDYLVSIRLATSPRGATCRRCHVTCLNNYK